MNGQPTSLHFGLSQQQQQQQTSLNNRIQQQQQNQQQQQPQLHQLALVSTNQQTQQQHHNHQQQQQTQQTQQYLLQSNYLGLPAEVFTSGNITGNAPSTAIVVSSMGGGQSSYRPQQQQQQMYAQKESIHNSTAQGKETPSPLAALPLHQMAQLVQVQPELVIQMQQNYEAQIRALQMELQAVKNVPVVPYNPLIQPSGTTTLTLTPSIPSGVKASHKRSQHSSPNIVETYCENIQMKQFTCKNCPYKTKSEASLIIHNTNHLVNQRYLHLPTTVFSVRPSPNRDSSTYMYPCGECSGKFSHNDLYLHIYQHHTGEAPFHCDECDLFFMHYEFLDDHQRSTHMKNPSKKKPRYHQSSEQQSQQNQQQNCQPPGGVPQLTYYSVVKCSKPFSVLTAMSRNPNSPGGPVGGLTWPGTTTTTGGGSAGVNNHEPEPVAYPYHHTVAHKRGRGRGGSSNANRTSIPFPSTSGTTSGSTSSTTSVNGTTRSEPEPNAGPDANGQYKCHFEECFFVSDSKDRLEFHLFAHRSSRFKCPYCPYVSNVLNDIKRHVVKGQKHEGVMFTCPNNPCDFGTNCDKTFRDHMRSVHFGKQTDDKQLTNFIEDMFRNGRTSTT